MNAPNQKPVPKPTPKPTPKPRESRMTLASITRGVVQRPYRILVYGVEGVGKSTFAAEAPSTVFIGAEDGTKHLDVARFPEITDFQDVRDAIRALTTEPHDHRTLAIDTIDWLEPYIWRHVCSEDGAASIEKAHEGYGKGYVAALDVWRTLLADLENLQRRRGMNVILLGHTAKSKFINPEGEDYERYELKIHASPKASASGLVREWCEVVLFARFEEYLDVKKTRSGKVTRARAFSTGARVLLTQRTAAFDAKTRYALPHCLPLSWEEFDRAAKSGQSPEEIRNEIDTVVSELEDGIAERVRVATKAAGDDVSKLANILNHARLQPQKEKTDVA